ncbi:hypothetical protein [Burkholderia orbicola]|uniref:hypothetical protein n=1 Tax=Burkholderia orbicola TaxID=2978683 RepID=UPI00210E6B91
MRKAGGTGKAGERAGRAAGSGASLAAGGPGWHAKAQFYLLTGRAARDPGRRADAATLDRRPPAWSRRKYQTSITSSVANSYAVRYRALAHVHRIDVRAKNSLNVLSTPNRPTPFAWRGR